VKTRFSSLVKLKKSTMRKSEQLVHKANTALTNASLELELSYESLKDVHTPTSGTIKDMLASRVLFESQRGVIQHNRNWVEFANNQLLQAKQQLKLDMIEYEKFNYLELQEIKKEIKKKNLKEAKELDEVALITFKGKDKL